MSDRRINTEIGIGTTDELSLRVSVATLVRVLFKHQAAGETMLALERRATLREAAAGQVVDVKSQPFGGAIRIHDLRPLQNLIGDFHFDSEQSRAEQDFRLFIRPSAWEAVREFCWRHFRQPDNPVLESDPRRELAEEFAETLQVHVKLDQYIYEPMGIMIENDPSPTENLDAKGYPTARIYRIFEARILDPSLADTIMKTSKRCSDQDLCKLALEDVQNGGLGRANTVLTLPLHHVTDAYLSITLGARNSPISFESYRLDETVGAVLDNVTVPKYQRL